MGNKHHFGLLFVAIVLVLSIVCVGFAFTNYANLHGADMNHATDGYLDAMQQSQNAVSSLPVNLQDGMALVAVAVIVIVIFLLVIPADRRK